MGSRGPTGSRRQRGLGSSALQPPPCSSSKVQFMPKTVDLLLDVASYRLTAIKKAAYKFSDRCTVVLKPQEGDRIPITLEVRQESGADQMVRAFYDELLDQELREQIADETSAVRTLILAHAFSKVDLIKRD
jgi:His-Xaa-Ser system protein HxsD